MDAFANIKKKEVFCDLPFLKKGHITSRSSQDQSEATMKNVATGELYRPLRVA